MILTDLNMIVPLEYHPQATYYKLSDMEPAIF